MEAASRLTVADHSRDCAGLTYVYPVVSRRAKGVSLGINLNPNNACNWQCVYCQVPGLVRGNAPPIDLQVLERELRQMLDAICLGDYLAQHAPPDSQALRDIAFSGNGEPTSAKEFAEAVQLVARIRADYDIASEVKTRLITNGSLLHQPSVQEGISKLEAISGEVWFKLDTPDPARARYINGTPRQTSRHIANLLTCAQLCPTWVQTCLFRTGGELSLGDPLRYADLLAPLAPHIRGVLLYGLARPSMQSSASLLEQATPEDFNSIAQVLRNRGISVQITP